MIYSDGDLRKALEAGALVIAPRPARSQFSTSAVDLRLDSRFNVFDAPPDGTEIVVHAATANAEAVAQRYGRAVNVPSGSHIDIPPKAFALAYTLEQVSVPLNLAARVEGKSSIARLGLSIHQSAPTIHAGFRGHIRLEIANIGPFVCRLHPGMQICQLIIEELKNLPEDELQSRFQNQSPF